MLLAHICVSESECFSLFSFDRDYIGVVISFTTTIFTTAIASFNNPSKQNHVYIFAYKQCRQTLKQINVHTFELNCMLMNVCKTT